MASNNGAAAGGGGGPRGVTSVLLTTHKVVNTAAEAKTLKAGTYTGTVEL